MTYTVSSVTLNPTLLLLCVYVNVIFHWVPEEFHQIQNVGTLGDKNELIRFWDQKVTVAVRPDMVINLLLGLFYHHRILNGDSSNWCGHIVGTSAILDKIRSRSRSGPDQICFKRLLYMRQYLPVEFCLVYAKMIYNIVSWLLWVCSSGIDCQERLVAEMSWHVSSGTVSCWYCVFTSRRIAVNRCRNVVVFCTLQLLVFSHAAFGVWLYLRQY